MWCWRTQRNKRFPCIVASRQTRDSPAPNDEVNFRTKAPERRGGQECTSRRASTIVLMNEGVTETKIWTFYIKPNFELPLREDVCPTAPLTQPRAPGSSEPRARRRRGRPARGDGSWEDGRRRDLATGRETRSTVQDPRDPALIETTLLGLKQVETVLDVS